MPRTTRLRRLRLRLMPGPLAITAFTLPIAAAVTLAAAAIVLTPRPPATDRTLTCYVPTNGEEPAYLLVRYTHAASVVQSAREPGTWEVRWADPESVAIYRQPEHSACTVTATEPEEGTP